MTIDTGDQVLQRPSGMVYLLFNDGLNWGHSNSPQIFKLSQLYYLGMLAERARIEAAQAAERGGE